jgi:signal peptidase I
LSYEFRTPRRWDVIVFRYPYDAPTNFIKRLVGLPGETIRIRGGDIWVKRAGSNDRHDFEIARKPPDKLLAMLQPVFDNDYMDRIAAWGWPARWYSDQPAADGAAGAWISKDWTTFRNDGTAAGETWLRYHHLAPSYQQWQQEEERPSSAPRPTPQLITDFVAYDTGRNQWDVANRPPDTEALGVNWVGDLAVACTVEVDDSCGELAFELCKGGRRFQCRTDVSTGRATLSVSGRDMEHWRPTATTSIRGKGTYTVCFSNCDEQLLLWVDGEVVAFDSPTTYEDLGNSRPEGGDLAPVGIASRGARLEISHLRVLRDIYYIATREGLDSRGIRDHDHVDFPLGAGQFFVLGDNSAKSKDGRLWGAEYWVGHELLIGKALFIYWPHSWNEIPYVNIPFPYFPNFARMRLVR